MSEAKHTPGPWSVYDSFGKTLAVCIGKDANGKRPCIVDWPGFDSCDLPFRQQRANAHLIAAAPDLLAVVRELIAAIADKSIQRSPAYRSDDIEWLGRRAAKALAKAEGRT